jgi:hypothetical protein
VTDILDALDRLVDVLREERKLALKLPPGHRLLDDVRFDELLLLGRYELEQLLLRATPRDGSAVRAALDRFRVTIWGQWSTHVLEAKRP